MIAENDNSIVPLSNGKGKKLFEKGNKVALGHKNPFSAHRIKYAQALVEAFKAGDLKNVVMALVKKAKGGDTEAAKVLLDRALGKAVQPMELSQGDGEPVTFTLNIKTAGRE